MPTMVFSKRLTLSAKNLLTLLCLAVLALGGCSDSRPPLSASFTYEGVGDSGTPPYQVKVDASSSTGNITNYQWDFGDGTNGIAGLTNEHTFEGYGNFRVTLIVTDDNFDQQQIIQEIPVGYSLSGTIIAQPGSVVDSDVNDPLAVFASNDTPATAQTVSNPAIVGGFASAIATSEDEEVNSIGDRFEFIADKFDTYRVTLTANQTIALSISNYRVSEPNKHDLDLYLFGPLNALPFSSNACDSPNNPIAFSKSSSSVEHLVVPTDGIYNIIVCALKGYSSYVLTIGNATVLDTGSVLSIQDEFVPGDVIVKFKENAASQPGLLVDTVVSVQNLSVKNRAASIGMVAKAGQPGAAMLFGLGGEKQKKIAFSVLGIKVAASNEKINSRFSDPQKQLKSNTIMAVKALRLRSDVASADLNYIRHPLVEPNDPDYISKQWHYPLINLPKAWDAVTTPAVPGTNIVVAVVDTGVVLSHPDLAGKLVQGYDFISSLSIAIDGDGRDSNPDDPGDEDGEDDESIFHGTHVAGTVAALSDNGLNVAGVAWKTNTKVMPIRALGLGGGTSFDIMEGVRYAAGLSNSEETDAETTARIAAGNVADIINLSLGGGRYSQFEQDTFNQVRNANAGVIVVAAAGNRATDVPSYPASYDGVISVSAVSRLVLSEKIISRFSNFGQFIDIAAPGGDGRSGDNGVFSTSATGFFDIDNAIDRRTPITRSLSGTSMASPHVAGVAALMKAVYPNMTPLEFDIMLETGSISTDVSGDGARVRNDKFGFGLVDAEKAVRLAKLVNANGSDALPAFLSISSKSYYFPEPGASAGQQSISAELNISNLGGGNFILAPDISSPPWLSVAPIMVDQTTKLGRYSVTVNRTGLSNAQYQGVILFNYSGDISGSVNVPVTMQVGPLSRTGDTGFQYGILLDAADNKKDTVIIGNSINGSYNYSINGVKPGKYAIKAVSDLNNFSINDDPGEASGEISRVTVTTNNIENLNFTSRFQSGGGIQVAE
ncbi:MAG: S8 family serine peptidase [Gammaproteobacteria bacterium]|nr:S8 family serine peptidase [Gammaproteobacteria bacterium]